MYRPFEKWHGCKNDFVVLRMLPQDGPVEMGSLQRQASKICARDGSGVGADGVIAMHYASKDDIIPLRLTIINSDGSMAQTCGNGIRCAAMAVLKDFRARGNKFDDMSALDFQLENRSVRCQFMASKGATGWPLVSVGMGRVTFNEGTDWWDAGQEELARVAKELALPQLTQDAHGVSIGNRHIVIFLNEADRQMLHRVGPALQRSRHWDGINVHLAVEKSFDKAESSRMRNLLGGDVAQAYDVLVWERGAGPTQACGSGACAVATAVAASGFSESGKWVASDMPGGRLFARYDDATKDATLAGPAEFVFSGTLEI